MTLEVASTGGSSLHRRVQKGGDEPSIAAVNDDGRGRDGERWKDAIGHGISGISGSSLNFLCLAFDRTARHLSASLQAPRCYRRYEFSSTGYVIASL